MPMEGPSHASVLNMKAVPKAVARKAAPRPGTSLSVSESPAMQTGMT